MPSPPDDHPPRRAARVCGALGRYDPELVAAMGRALGIDGQPAHAGGDAMLLIDRAPLRWRTLRQRGLAWSEWPGRQTGSRQRSWRHAAADASACGLVLDRRGSFVHSSVSGTQPVYHRAHGGAVYFASRIDPLVQGLPGGLSPDWDAWSAIITLTVALGASTPFAEIRRLPPYATLACRGGRAEVSEEAWPWSEVEPDQSVESGASQVLAAAESAIGRLPEGPLAVPLSGGLDSRVIAAIAAPSRREDIRTFTSDVDEGTDREQRFGARVAAELGLRNELVTGSKPRFWQHLDERVARGEYQRASTGWMMALVERLEREGLPTPDGLGLDTLGQPRRRFLTEEVVRAPDGDAAIRGLWRANRRPLPVFKPELERAMKASARRQFLAESTRFAGHPSRVVLTLYRTRIMRGIGLFARNVLGHELPVATPFVEDEVARAALAIRSSEKQEDALYTALFERLDSRMAAIPSTHDPIDEERKPQYRRSPEVVREYCRRLGDGPLAAHLSERGRELAAQAAAESPRGVPPDARAATIFHAWHARYRDRLGDSDPIEALGAPRRAGVSRG